jgi:hypothetical protein
MRLALTLLASAVSAVLGEFGAREGGTIVLAPALDPDTQALQDAFDVYFRAHPIVGTEGGVEYTMYPPPVDRFLPKYKSWALEEPSFQNTTVLAPNAFSKYIKRGFDGSAGGFGNALTGGIMQVARHLATTFPFHALAGEGAGLKIQSSHLMWLPTIPIAMLRRDAKVAFAKYVDETKQSSYIEEHTQPGDVLIHYRCGDIVMVESNNAGYGVFPFSWIADQIPANSKRLFVLGNGFGPTKDARKGDDASMGRCGAILAALTKYLTGRTGLPVEFIAKDCMTDFVLLAHAPTLIGTGSTFSMWAAMMNEQRSILPHCRVVGLPLGALFDKKGALGTVDIVPSACLRSGSTVFESTDAELVKVLEQPVNVSAASRKWRTNVLYNQGCGRYDSDCLRNDECR